MYSVRHNAAWLNTLMSIYLNPKLETLMTPVKISLSNKKTKISENFFYHLFIQPNRSSGESFSMA
jgi:hypothetical protein